MTLFTAATAYYQEPVTIVLDRITLMCMIGACLLALKHPDFKGPNADMVRTALKELIPFVDLHVPPPVLKEWNDILEMP